MVPVPIGLEEIMELMPSGGKDRTEREMLEPDQVVTRGRPLLSLTKNTKEAALDQGAGRWQREWQGASSVPTIPMHVGSPKQRHGHGAAERKGVGV
jgi:hypothetical protein